MKLPYNLALLAGVCLIFASCSAGPTAAKRADSFAPYEDLKVGEDRLQKHVMLRFAIVLSVDEFVINPSSNSPQEQAEAFQGFGTLSSSRGIGVGSAAAIDRRGYFLTADHNLSKGSVYLLIPTSDGKVRSEQPRVVWRGEGLNFDLALLHITPPVEHVFEWASHFEKDEEIIAVGLNSEFEDDPANVNMKAVAFGGNLLEVIQQKFGEIPYEWIVSNAPIQSGDSGGPIINKEGQLIGINFAESRPFLTPWIRHSWGVRPDLEWLRQVIEEDFASQ